jgi:hypothetical protein
LDVEKILRNEVACVLKSLEDNPYLHQWEVDVNLPAGKYRRVVFAKRYKASKDCCNLLRR